MSNSEFALQLIVAATALVGAVLGVVNLLLQLRSDRVRLKLVPLSAHYQGAGPNGSSVYLTDANQFLRKEKPPHSIAFSVVNLSTFPITISEIGFGTRQAKARSSVYLPTTDQGGSLPVKMQPRTTATFYVRLTELIEPTRKSGVKSAYVKTECGVVIDSSTEVLHEMERYLVDKA